MDLIGALSALSWQIDLRLGIGIAQLDGSNLVLAGGTPSHPLSSTTREDQQIESDAYFTTIRYLRITEWVGDECLTAWSTV